MNHRTVFVANPLDYTGSSRYIETPGCPDGYLAVISTCLLPVRDNCSDNISSPETFDYMSCFSRSPRESKPVHPTHLPRPMPCCLNLRHLHPQIKLDLIAGLTDTGCVNPVGFRIALLSAIELCPATGPERYR